MNVISDIDTLREVLKLDGSEETIPEILVVYLLANQGLINLWLEQTYKPEKEAQRFELCKIYNELHETAAHNSFKEIAEWSLDIAKNYWNWLEMDTIEDDNLNMLRRGLCFAKYMALSGKNHRLFMHPINDYLPFKRKKE